MSDWCRYGPQTALWEASGSPWPDGRVLPVLAATPLRAAPDRSRECASVVVGRGIIEL